MHKVIGKTEGPSVRKLADFLAGVVARRKELHYSLERILRNYGIKPVSFVLAPVHGMSDTGVHLRQTLPRVMICAPRFSFLLRRSESLQLSRVLTSTLT
jgi:hypothetical protein